MQRFGFFLRTKFLRLTIEDLRIFLWKNTNLFNNRYHTCSCAYELHAQETYYKSCNNRTDVNETIMLFRKCRIEAIKSMFRPISILFRITHTIRKRLKDSKFFCFAKKEMKIYEVFFSRCLAYLRSDCWRSFGKAV